MPCRLNRSLILAYTHGDQAALDSWIESFKLGVARYGVIDFALMARMQEESLFYSATNNIQLLYGWPRHAELYEAFQSLEQDHSALAADILRFVESEGNRNRDVISTIVIPLGAFHIEPIPSVMWSKEYARYRQSQEFQDFIRRSGILAYWRMHGFPPPCQSLDDNSFECD